MFPAGHHRFKQGGTEEGYYEKNKFIQNSDLIETYDIENSFIAQKIVWEDYIIPHEDIEEN